MRITFSIDHALHRCLVERAAVTGRTVDDVIGAALRVGLDVPPGSPSTGAMDLPVFHGTGLRPDVDLASNAALLAVMEDETALSPQR